MRSDDRHRHQPRSRNSLSLAHLMAETSLLQYEAPCRQLSTLLIGRSTYNKISHQGLFILSTGAKQLHLVNNYDLDQPSV